MSSRFIAAVVLLASSAWAVAAPKDDVQAAIQKLNDANSYSWTTTVEGGFGGGDGKTQKDGYTVLSLAMRDSSFPVVIKGDKAVAKTDDGWKLGSELTEDQSLRFLGFALQNFRTPASYAKELSADITDCQKSEDAYTAELPPDVAKKFLVRPRRNANGGDNNNGPTVSNAKGQVKVWLADGAITKLQLHISGTVSRNGNDRDVDRTTTSEIKDIDKTTVDVPAEAKAKLEAPPATQP